MSYIVTLEKIIEECPLDKTRTKNHCLYCSNKNNPCKGIGNASKISSMKIEDTKAREILKLIKIK